MSAVRIAAVIPARMASTRFPGKPLLPIHGLPMVEHVRRRALLCGRFSEVVVATCDRPIEEAIRRLGGQVVMTSPQHPAATDRVAEAALQLDCTHVVNVQGDEILVLPQDLRRVASAIEENPSVPAWNAVAPLEDPRELNDPSVVKCAVSISGRILFCSRSFAALRKQKPFVLSLSKDEPVMVRQAHHDRVPGTVYLIGRESPIRRILGILAYRRDFLDRYRTLERTPLEIAEAIDQSRILEHDVPLQSVPFPKGYIGINEQREVELVQNCLEGDPCQRSVLQEILVQ